MTGKTCFAGATLLHTNRRRMPAKRGRQGAEAICAPGGGTTPASVSQLATSRIKPRGGLGLASVLARCCDAPSVAAGPRRQEFVARRRRPRRVRECSMSPANFEAEKTVEHGVHLLRDHERAEMPRADRPGDHQPPT